MAHRRWLIPLLFAAVFAMHGFPYIGASGSTHAMAISASSPQAAVTHGAWAVEDHVTPFAAATAVTKPQVAPVARSGAIGMNKHPMGLMGHMWTACLAVLSVALAVLLAAVAVVRVRRWLPSLPRGGVGWASAPLQSPAPDLSALCVLRI